MPASVSIFTQVQCGQNGASSRDFQYTVSIPVIFVGAIICATAQYLAASGEASSPVTNNLLFIFIGISILLSRPPVGGPVFVPVTILVFDELTSSRKTEPKDIEKARYLLDSGRPNRLWLSSDWIGMIVLWQALSASARLLQNSTNSAHSAGPASSVPLNVIQGGYREH